MSIIIDASAAQLIQNRAINEGELLIWTVFARPSDLPDRFVARPFLTLAEGPKPLAVHLEAPSLDELREKLPAYLSCLAPMEGDDPAVVETWL